MKTLKYALAAAVAITALSGTANAASDGTLGATSTGTAIVTMDINEQFQITDMADLALGAYGGTGDLTGNDDICVYHNGDGTYQVTISDDTTSAGFQVENAGDTEEIAMTVNWNDATGTAGAAAATAGTGLTGQTAANTQAADCSSGGLSANLSVVLSEADVQAASAGSYDSTLTVVIEAD